MERQFTQQEVDRHNALYEKGCALIEGEILLHDTDPVGQPRWFARQKLHRAIQCFQQALEINPEGWPSMWALGKIYQRLGESREALAWFGRAHAVNPDQPDVAREAGLAALEFGQGNAAVRYCEAAVKANPEDPGLVANLALAYLVSQDVAKAQRCAQEALARNPGDEISRRVLAVISEVTAGRRPCPRTMREIHDFL